MQLLSQRSVLRLYRGLLFFPHSPLLCWCKWKITRSADTLNIYGHRLMKVGWIVWWWFTCQIAMKQSILPDNSSVSYQVSLGFVGMASERGAMDALGKLSNSVATHTDKHCLSHTQTHTDTHRHTQTHTHTYTYTHIQSIRDRQTSTTQRKIEKPSHKNWQLG